MSAETPKFNNKECKKECNCIELAEAKNAGNPVKNYQCLNPLNGDNLNDLNPELVELIKKENVKNRDLILSNSYWAGMLIDLPKETSWDIADIIVDSIKSERESYLKKRVEAITDEEIELNFKTTEGQPIWFKSQEEGKVTGAKWLKNKLLNKEK